jgi:hypothetical protein
MGCMAALDVEKYLANQEMEEMVEKIERS